MVPKSIEKKKVPLLSDPSRWATTELWLETAAAIPSLNSLDGRWFSSSQRPASCRSIGFCEIPYKLAKMRYQTIDIEDEPMRWEAPNFQIGGWQEPPQRWFDESTSFADANSG